MVDGRSRRGGLSRAALFAAAALGLMAGCSDAPAAAAAEQQASRARAPAVVDYRGVYVPGGKEEKGLRSEVLNSDAVDGIVLTLNWNQVEPRKGQYDFSTFDREAKRVVASGKVMAVGIKAGEAAPEWLYTQEGVGRFRAIMGPHGGKGGRCWAISVPRPWDPAYLAAYDRLMQAFAKHLREEGLYDDVRRVKIGGINMHTGETRMPSGRGADKRSAEDRAANLQPDITGETGKGGNKRKFRRRQPCVMTDSVTQWQEFGYRPSKVVGAWRSLAGSVGKAFPDKLLSSPILNNGGFPAIDENGKYAGKNYENVVLRQIIDAGATMFPNRFGVQWNGLNNAPLKGGTLYAKERDVIIGLQTNLRGANSGGGAKCRAEPDAEPQACTPELYAKVMDSAVKSGASYIEVWQADLARYPDVIKRTSRTLRSRPL
jgi:hypothetical protein